MRDLRVDAADGQVHLGKPPGGVVRLLSVDRDVAEPAAMRLDEFLGADEHAARAAAGIVDAALVRREHLDQHAHHVARRIELAALLAFGAGELREEVFVDLAEDVLGAVGRAAEADIAHQVDELAQALLVEAGPGVVLGQHALQRRVVALDRAHRVVDDLADGRLRRARLEIGPARLLRDPEDVDRAVLVGVLGIGALRRLGFELGVLRLEGVGDVFEEDQSEDDVLVLGGIHVVAQRIRRRPQLRLERAIAILVLFLLFCCATSRHRCFSAPSSYNRNATPSGG